MGFLRPQEPARPRVEVVVVSVFTFAFEIRPQIKNRQTTHESPPPQAAARRVNAREIYLRRSHAP